MNWIILNGFVFFVSISKCLAGLNVLNAVANLASRPLSRIATNTKDFIQIASDNGYNAEKHEVITNDGYILTMHRIPPGGKCPKKIPLLLMHGLLQASEGFISSGTDAPGFVLAQECYDTWFGNVRGNYHSRRHQTLDPDRDLEFWKFSVDEIGLFDIPAMIDYVLDTTRNKKLIYIGYSQGGGTFFIMNSEKPEYADKISLFIGLSPALRHYHTKSEVFRKLSIAANPLQATLEAAGVWEILSEGFPIQETVDILFQVELVAAIVSGLALPLLDSPHLNSTTPEIIKKLVENAPAGTSIQNFARYGQAMTALKFIKFDYGSEHNLKIYGTFEPPEYNLKAVTMPAVVFHGMADHVVDKRDLEWAVEQLPNLLEYVTVEDPLWNHIDMTYSRYWKDTIFVKMKNYLNKYDSVTHHVAARAGAPRSQSADAQGTGVAKYDGR